ncbi:nuclease-related domain-containing protein [Peribacillus tepidiphilus]|uniref:nuclease-related domain-containing protein n=1 Tax=Peribacillus tepidiphilus TaxID=2652445 RepID=UPI0012923DA2|nr:nuclease-related domain-containing protein [Peribacillus tepidiphilus]
MIVKERKKSLKLLKLEALDRRLSLEHPKKKEVQLELGKASAGYHGECSLDYYISFLANQNLYIFHDLRLSSGTYHFQIDTLMVSPAFMLLLEIKNISGTLSFDHHFNQLIKTIDGEDVVFSDPIQQVKHQKFQLSQWLQKHNLPSLPIEFLVVVSNLSAQIKKVSKSDAVIRSSQFVEKVQSLYTQYKQNVLQKCELQKLENILLKNDTPYNPDILAHFKINPSDILTGVVCPFCSSIPMIRNKGKWTCPTCNQTSHNAHLDALRDFALLFQPSIQNRQVKEFLHLYSSSGAHKLLSTLHLPYEGTTKARVYSLEGFLCNMFEWKK